MTTIRLTIALGASCLLSAVAHAQTGLQGFDPNYPNTPAADGTSGFTTQVSPPAPPPPPPTTTVLTDSLGNADVPGTQDPGADGSSDVLPTATVLTD